MTAEEIAKIAGVSRSTVTGVVNDYSFISDVTKEKVRKVIDKYGYVPNSAGRQLVGKKTNLLGHFIFGQGDKKKNAYFNGLIVDTIEAAQERGYSMVTCMVMPDENRQAINLLFDGTIQGAIVTGDGAALFAKDGLLKSKAPLVFVGNLPDPAFSYRSYKNAHFLDLDNFKAGYAATEYLVRKGHRSILHVAGQLNRPTAIDRLGGYRKALEDNGIAYDEGSVLCGEYRDDRAEMLFTERVSAGESLPTAVFAANDMSAIGVMRACRKMGLRVPEDISVVGIDDIALGREMQPALTTMRPGESGSIAELAIARLIDSIEGKRVPQVMTLDPVLVERLSVSKR